MKRKSFLSMVILVCIIAYPFFGEQETTINIITNLRNALGKSNEGNVKVVVNELISVSSTGVQGNSESLYSRISDDGRFVAFDSMASNLVDGDTNFQGDVFIRDRSFGITERISVASDGSQGNGFSHAPSISANGRYLTFASDANNLVLGDTNGVRDIFFHDTDTGKTERVSVSSSGEQGNQDSYISAVSNDGSYVAFDTRASNFGLVSGVFVRDRVEGQTELISKATDGTPGNKGASDHNPDMTADGRFVAFNSHSDNLVSGDSNNSQDIFVHDRETGQTERVSIASDGTQGNGWSFSPSISDDGQIIAFVSHATNLVSGDTNNTMDVFVHDRNAGSTVLVSKSSDGIQGNLESSHPSISPDGRYVVFESIADNLVPNDNNVFCDFDDDSIDETCMDIFIHDLHTGQTQLASFSHFGGQSNKWSSYPDISSNGLFTVYRSSATNLVVGDANEHADIFFRFVQEVEGIFVPLLKR